jgi:putative DNA primase/helicase
MRCGMVAVARKFATRDEAFAFVLLSGPTPEAKAVAKKWFIGLADLGWEAEARETAREIEDARIATRELFIWPRPQPNGESRAEAQPASPTASPKAEPEKVRRRKVVDPEPKPKGDAEALKAAINKARVEAEIKAEIEAVKAEPEAGPEPKPAEPEVEEEPEDEPEVEAPEPAAEEEEEVVLSKRTPMLSTKLFAKRLRQRDFLATYFYKKNFWRWNGRHYAVVEEIQIEGEVYAFLDRAKTASAPGELARFQLTPRDAEAVVKCLKAGLAMGPGPMQCWLDTGTVAPTLIAFKNCLVDYETGEVLPLTPRLWITDGLDIDFDPKAECPRWDRFREEVFPGDRESQDCLEEQLGYGMTNENKFEKGALWIGKKRSGKSTCAWVQKKLVGDRSYIGLSFHTWLKNENTASAMIGKKVGVFGDVRLKPAKQYGAVGFDAGGMDHVSAEMLLKTIGRDTQALGEKYERKPHDVELWIKFIILSNEPPNLQDAGGVLASRFIKMEFRETFWGREDPNLREKLEAELPGIANRCLAAYRRLSARGRFIQPQAGLELERKIEAKVNPFAAFMQDCWIAEEGHDGPTVGEFYIAFSTWCCFTGRAWLLVNMTKQQLIQRINEIDGWEWLKSGRPHGKPRCYAGIRRCSAKKDDHG